MQASHEHGVDGFEWGEWNREKNWSKHKTGPEEVEEVFFNDPLFVYRDAKHSVREGRYYCLGRTNMFRLLYVVFTLRLNKIRVISARDMSKRERIEYEKGTKKNSKV